jgi:5-formyltetrahydrofolate cyclo-ligase
MKSVKSQFRKQIKAKLSLVSQESIEIQSAKVTSILVGLPEFQNAQKISVFLSMPTELSTRGIVDEIFKSGKDCYVPLCSKTEMVLMFLM